MASVVSMQQIKRYEDLAPHVGKVIAFTSDKPSSAMREAMKLAYTIEEVFFAKIPDVSGELLELGNAEYKPGEPLTHPLPGGKVGKGYKFDILFKGAVRDHTVKSTYVTAVEFPPYTLNIREITVLEQEGLISALTRDEAQFPWASIGDQKSRDIATLRSSI